MAIRGNGPLLFLLFFFTAVLLAGVFARVGGRVLEGRADHLAMVLFLLSVIGLVLSLLIVARILYLSVSQGRLATEEAK